MANERYKSSCVEHRRWQGLAEDAPPCVLAMCFNEPDFDACTGNYQRAEEAAKPASWPDRIKNAAGSLLADILGFDK